MAANQYGVDLAAAFQAGENIKGARTANKMNAMKLAEMERLEEERPERERLAKGRQNTLSALRSMSTQGNQQAQQQLLALDPEGAPAFLDAIGKMDQKKLEETKRGVDMMGQMAGTVLNAPPEKQAGLYSQMLTMLPPDSVAKMPKQFDRGFMEMSLAKASTMDKILENPKSVTLGGQDVLFKGGREVERADKPVKPSATSGDQSGTGGLKSTDENTMYRQSAELLGGLFDQDGNITNLDPDTRNKVQGIAARATNIFRTVKGITRTQAVVDAAKEYGFDIKEPGQEKIDYNDPEQIKNILLQ